MRLSVYLSIAICLFFFSCKKEAFRPVEEVEYENSPEMSAFEEEVLDLLNAARSKDCRCGDADYPAVDRLYFNATVDLASEKHVQDMSVNNFISHLGSDGSTPSERLESVGYKFFFSGENIAEGPKTSEVVIQEFIKSPGHCATIMNENYVHVGIARLKDYWVLNFAKPRN